MRNRSKVTILAVLALLVVGVIVAAQPVFACEEGCTPGYWKQPHHSDSWVGYGPGETLQSVFGCGGNTTLLQALRRGGGGENAFWRHAVAGLLNAANPDVDYDDVDVIMGEVGEACSDLDFETHKDKFEGYNELGCPLN